ncbi:hypothetical protein [Spirosoma pollinicola]|uniref:Uncharacterized protein n=1 Tax=Spirosoma pollinicola TaxID=2057025 RepID=A0A2K8Z5G9_9BACT|nr:hypothetical protein [Spirosoma pollinicola]AUD05137.1 hypothetical protein CWM47_26805 [Spirosoma pollinicola]
MESGTRIPFEDFKYLTFTGYAEISVNADGRLTIVLFDEKRTPINAENPLVISEQPLKLVNMELLAAFTKDSFDLNKETILKMDPAINELEKAEVPTRKEMPDMNPIHPPTKGGGGN